MGGLSPLGVLWIKLAGVSDVLVCCFSGSSWIVTWFPGFSCDLNMPVLLTREGVNAQMRDALITYSFGDGSHATLVVLWVSERDAVTAQYNVQAGWKWRKKKEKAKSIVHLKNLVER